MTWILQPQIRQRLANRPAETTMVVTTLRGKAMEARSVIKKVPMLGGKANPSVFLAQPRAFMMLLEQIPNAIPHIVARTRRW